MLLGKVKVVAFIPFILTHCNLQHQNLHAWLYAKKNNLVLRIFILEIQQKTAINPASKSFLTVFQVTRSLPPFQLHRHRLSEKMALGVSYKHYHYYVNLMYLYVSATEIYCSNILWHIPYFLNLLFSMLFSHKPRLGRLSIFFVKKDTPVIISQQC